jgi:putative heme d1 biosynthesis radical SAM protein NirJ1
MLSISKILCDTGSQNYGDFLRYNETSRGQESGVAQGYGPVVAWNITRACNLRCQHCYAAAGAQPGDNELTTAEAKKLIAELADYRVPALLLSGGEPLCRPDFFELAGYATQRGLRLTLSTNGTLITRELAQKIKELGISYVGISLDGVGVNNDNFRGRKGAYGAALEGIRNCLAQGQKVGLRFTVNRYNLHELGPIFDVADREGIERVCIYHLAYAGRAGEIKDADLTRQERRQVLDYIISRTRDLHSRGKNIEVLTVNNHADGAYLYLTLSRLDPERAQRAYQLLKYNGGNRSGIAIGAIDWEGNVHPDQFTLQHTLGNIRERRFSEIWEDKANPLLADLRNRKPLLKGRCGACRWLEICNGNSRGRAEAVYDDYWEQDPACYLTDQEIL